MWRQLHLGFSTGPAASSGQAKHRESRKSLFPLGILMLTSILTHHSHSHSQSHADWCRRNASLYHCVVPLRINMLSPSNSSRHAIRSGRTWVHLLLLVWSIGYSGQAP